MELVGRITRVQKTADNRLQAEFCCTNGEIFYFFVPPIVRPSDDDLVRCETQHLEKKGSPTGEDILCRWEKL
jgi:hypothetical protein